MSIVFGLLVACQLTIDNHQPLFYGFFKTVDYLKTFMFEMVIGKFFFFKEIGTEKINLRWDHNFFFNEIEKKVSGLNLQMGQIHVVSIIFSRIKVLSCLGNKQMN